MRLLDRLREDLVLRRIDDGLSSLEGYRHNLESLDPTQGDGAVLLGYLAQWVDIGFRDTDLVERVLARFSGCVHEKFSVFHYVHFEMACGLIAMSKQDFGEAIGHFETVLAVGCDIRDKEPISVANFWIGRCLREKGRYADALIYVAVGKHLALDLGYPKMAAVMQVSEGWIAFKQGKLKEATKILAEAEAELGQTDDHVRLGNIHSAYGRIARRQSRYDLALHHFGVAIEQYRKRDPHHRNLARSLVNIAFVKQLLAVQVSNRIDNAMALARKRHATTGSGIVSRESRELVGRLRGEALEYLSRAQKIYRRYDDHRGQANVWIKLGYLHMENGELDRASALGEKTFGIGLQQRDDILRARARMLQCAIERSRLEEGVGEHSHHDPSVAQALEFGHESLEYARVTQNPRLLAKAKVVLGLACSLNLSDHMEEALACATEAEGLLDLHSHDYVWNLLQELKTRLRNAGTIDSTLRAWSQGMVGNKTFQQLSEEFAAIVIPKVWRREGCKVARVASRLSMSPKKVRRILRDQEIVADSNLRENRTR